MIEKIISDIKAKSAENYSEEQYEAVKNTIENKLEISDLQSKDIEIKPGPEEVIVIHVEDETYYADPENEYSMEQGIKSQGAPPEGKTTDGKGNTKYGVR